MYLNMQMMGRKLGNFLPPPPLDPTAIVHIPLISDFYSKGVDRMIYQGTKPRVVTDPDNPQSAINLDAGVPFFHPDHGLWLTGDGTYDLFRIFSEKLNGLREWTAEVEFRTAALRKLFDLPFWFNALDNPSTNPDQRVCVNIDASGRLRGQYKGVRGGLNVNTDYGSTLLSPDTSYKLRFVCSDVTKLFSCFLDGEFIGEVIIPSNAGYYMATHRGVAKFTEYGGGGSTPWPSDQDGTGTGVGGDSLDGDGGFWIRNIKFWDGLVIPDMPQGQIVDLPFHASFFSRGIDSHSWTSKERVVTDPNDDTLPIPIPENTPFFHPEHGLWATGDGTWDLYKADIRGSLLNKRQWTIEFDIKLAALTLYDVPVIFNDRSRNQSSNAARFGLYVKEDQGNPIISIFYRHRDGGGAIAIGSKTVSAGDSYRVRVTSNADNGEVKAYLDNSLFAEGVIDPANRGYLEHLGWFKFTEFGQANNDDGTGTGVGGDSLDGDGGYWLRNLKFLDGVVPPKP